MNSAFAFPVGSFGVLWGLALVLKVTGVLLLGSLVAAALHRASAAVRHFAWQLTLLGAVTMGLATLILPPLTWRVASWPVAVRNERAASAAPVTLPAGQRLAALPLPAAELTAPTPGTAQPFALPERLPLLLAGVWLAGVLAVAGWCAAGHAGLGRLARSATPLEGDDWKSLLESVAARRGVRAAVRLLRARAAYSPMTWGVRRPIVLLPDDAESWPLERRRVVLEHELAHAARADTVAQLFACAACALYWFHPLVWRAARELRAESERACDDLVLSGGTPGVDYAAHLLEVARRARSLGAGRMIAIGMAQPSQLEGRLLAVLDEARARHAPRRRPRALGWAGLALLVLPLAALRIVPGAAQATERPVTGASKSVSGESEFEREVSASPGGRLEIELDSGGGIDVQGWDRPIVQVRAHLGGRDWRDTRVTLDRDGQGARLHSWQGVERKNSSTSHAFEIRVPRRYSVHVSSSGGEVILTDLDGEFSGHSGGGGLRLERVKGRASLVTGGGEIDVTDVDLSGLVSTGGGEVRLSRVRGPLRASSGSGPVIREDSESETSGDLSDIDSKDKVIHVGKRGSTKDAHGVLHIEKAGGDVVLEGAPAGARITTGGGEIRVGPSAGDVRAHTGGGDIVIGPVAGSVTAGTGSGDVSVTITGADGVERSVDITSGTGSAVLVLPSGLSAEFDLETGYTNNFGRRTRITSDWNLEREETTTWESKHGTPRKFVRAHGTVGHGGGLIHVKITNGDITVKRGR